MPRHFLPRLVHISALSKDKDDVRKAMSQAILAAAGLYMQIEVQEEKVVPALAMRQTSP